VRQALVSPPAPEEAGLAENRPGALDGVPSIAILPFEIAGEADLAQLGFAKAASREIATDLARSAGLVVVDADAVLGDASPPDAEPGVALDVGRELGVRYVLRGHVQPLDGRLKAIAQLIETGSGRIRWGIVLEADADASIAMQEAIVRGVVDNLRPILIPVCGTESPKDVC
jgi:TolB-like protein